MRPAHYHDAGPGDVSWLRALDDQAVLRFGGSVLFVPLEMAEFVDRVTYQLIPVPDPRFAFAHYFKGWTPPPPHLEIHPTARVDATAVLGREGFGFARAQVGASKGRLYRMPHVAGVVVDRGVEIGAHACVDRGCLTNTHIMTGAKIDNLVHVAHGVVVEPNCWVAAGAVLCGSSRLEENVEVGVNASILPGIVVGANARVGAGAVVTKHVPAGATVYGNPARVGGQGGRSEE